MKTGITFRTKWIRHPVTYLANLDLPTVARDRCPQKGAHENCLPAVSGGLQLLGERNAQTGLTRRSDVHKKCESTVHLRDYSRYCRISS